MRPQADRPNPLQFGNPFNRRRVVLIGIVAIIVALIASARAIAGVYTDFLWFDQLGFSSVWRSVLGAKISLGVLFTVLFFALCWASLAVADRIAPEFRTYLPGEEGLERLSDILRDHRRLVRTAVSGVFALLVGPAMVGQWKDWVLFRHSQTVGVRDAQFKKDVSFYLFRLPFLSAAVAWAFTALVLITVITAGSHFLNGGVRLNSAGVRVSSAVKAHLSVLLALVALAKAAGYWLNRYELALSTNGYVNGAGYTDIKARLPALSLLVAISLISVVLFVVNIRLRGVTLPVIAVGLWLLVSIVVAGVYPRVLQAIVKSSQFEREKKYIDRNIQATRASFGLADVKIANFNLDPTETPASASLLTDPSVQNLRLLEPSVDIAGGAFTRLQQVAPYFRFSDIDVDRYVINGKSTPVLISVRELDSGFNDITSWVKRRLNFTHGFGVAIAAANNTTADGQPNFLVRNLPPEGAIAFTQPRVYFGEHFDSHAIVGTKAREVDFTDRTGKDRSFSYDGKGGVVISSIARKVAFALRFADTNLLISNQVTPSSRMMYVRNIRDRAQLAAPFLHYDADPYPVVLNGRIVWVLDGYTTSTRYPYSQATSGEGGLVDSFNYVRNSVKVVIDAYDGTTSFFVIDEKDPVIRTYRSAFPKLFRTGAELDTAYPGLRAHFRYPEDLFRVQSAMFGQYHVTTAAQLFNKNDRWDISKDPGSSISGTRADPTAVTASRRMPAVYVLSGLPGQEGQRFFLQENLVPFSADDTQQNLRAVFVAESDPKNYGTLRAFVMPRNVQIDGPSLAADRMSAYNDVSVKESQLGVSGSEIRYANVQVIPVGKSLLYVRPMFVENKDSKLPLLTYVIVQFRDRIGFAKTLREALGQLVGGTGTAPTPTGSGKPTGSTGTSTTLPGSAPVPTLPPDASLATLTVDQLVTQAASAYDDAQVALAAKKLDAYQAKVDEMGRLLQEAQRRTTTSTAAPSASTPAPTTSVVGTASPSATTTSAP